jgi:hypothetical protein
MVAVADVTSSIIGLALNPGAEWGAAFLPREERL